MKEEKNLNFVKLLLELLPMVRDIPQEMKNEINKARVTFQHLTGK